MTVDLQLVLIQDQVPLRFMNYVPEMALPTLELRGKDFRTVSEVLINDVRSPSYLVMSDTRMLVQIPTTEVGTAIRGVTVLSRRFTATEKSIIRFRLGALNQGVRGLEKLVQHFVVEVLTTPGRDIFNKTRGGGLRSLIGTPTGKHSKTRVTGAFAQSVDRAASQMVARQSTQNLPPDEKLLAADLVGIDYDSARGEVRGRVQLASMAGQAAKVTLSSTQDDS